MTWILGVTALNWLIILALFLKRGSRGGLIEPLLLLAFMTQLLIGPLAIQQGLMLWVPLSAGMAWLATAGLLLGPFVLIMVLRLLSERLTAALVMAWYTGFMALGIFSLAELWGWGYPQACAIYFWPLATLVIPLVIKSYGFVSAILMKREPVKPEPSEEGNAPE